MTKNAVNLQDSFLNQVRREGNQISIVLTNGCMLEGVVAGFDSFTVVLHSGPNKHLIYKHAIAHLICSRSASESLAPKPVKDREKTSGDTGARNPKEEKAKNFNPIDLSGVSI
jgi:host factor-I protein